jgi:hypothetical protein
MTTTQQVSVSYDEVNTRSIQLLEALQGEQRAVGASAAALTLARIVAPRTLKMEEEIHATSELVAFAGALVGNDASGRES